MRRLLLAAVPRRRNQVSCAFIFLLLAIKHNESRIINNVYFIFLRYILHESHVNILDDSYLFFQTKETNKAREEGISLLSL